MILYILIIYLLNIEERFCLCHPQGTGFSDKIHVRETGVGGWVEHRLFLFAIPEYSASNKYFHFRVFHHMLYFSVHQELTSHKIFFLAFRNGIVLK